MNINKFNLYVRRGVNIKYSRYIKTFTPYLDKVRILITNGNIKRFSFKKITAVYLFLLSLNEKCHKTFKNLIAYIS